MKILKTILIAALIAATIPTTANAEELPDSVVIGAREITQEEKDLILRTAMGEAGNQGEYGMRLVISTIFNRVNDSRFPESITKVINQKYQFYTGYQGKISQECIDALEEEMLQQADDQILWFSSAGWPAYGSRAYQYGDHWFSK